LILIYNEFIISKGLKLGYTISKLLDRGFIEMVGPYGLSIKFYNLANNISKLDTGIITTYAIYFTIAALTFHFFCFC